MQNYDFFLAAKKAMSNILDKFKIELSYIKTNKANIALVENIKVESGNTFDVINKIATISVVNMKTIEIRPWNIAKLSEIERALFKANLGVSHVNNGKVIRVYIPNLTEERRKEIVKFIIKKTESFKIALRNERRILIENIKKLKRDKIIDEDNMRKFEVEAQKITNEFIEKINNIVIAKEKEIMQV
ncbi:MAG: ribosome recycling factor [Endomicrobium sp.]|jgi:ribosome recycling factor|nr:ribosome recycling factor [Endomicrobium sp.]